MKKNKKHRLERLQRRQSERREARNDRFTERYRGILRATVSGYGFVTPTARILSGNEGACPGELPQEIFIPPRDMGSAIDGDEVMVGILPPSYKDQGRGPCGHIMKVLKQGSEKIVGEVIAGRKVRPLNIRITGDIEVTGRTCGAKRGDWVEVKLHRDTESGERGTLHGTIASRIGKAGTVQGDLDAIMKEYDLPDAYTDEENRDALSVVPREIKRTDCRKLLTLTIDPADAKDFDDALSIRTIDKDHWEIGVHISDAAAWIQPNSKFDKQAAKRGMTCYLPGRTLPMLPKSLTAKISMQEGQEGAAHSVFFKVKAATGEILETRRCHTIVKIDRRLDYDTVQNFLDTGVPPEDWSAAEKRSVRRLADIAARWRQKRSAEEQFLDMEMPEVRVICDEAADRISGFEQRIQRQSEELVEEFMLAANSVVAGELFEKNVPAVYRIHEEPDPEKIAEFEMLSEECGIPTGDLTCRSEICAYIKRISASSRRFVLLNALLRSMPRAVYSSRMELHYGLGKMRYCHFTSPIRRYSDLAVHQQLWNLDCNFRLRDKGTMERFAEKVTIQEDNSDSAYFAACDRLKLRYLSERLDMHPEENFYEGNISKVLQSGLSVYIADLGIFGFVPEENLAKHLRSRRRSVEKHGTMPRYQVGDVIYLRLDHVDTAKGNAIFACC